MNETNWAEIERVFDAVMDAAPERRQAVLEQLCKDNDKLRESVQRLLDADRDAGEFLQQPAAVGEPSPPPQASDYALQRGDSIGIWAVVCPLGRGGMGEVYLADRSDGQYRQQAAIKRLPTRDPSRLVRFQRERQILADLDHPNIARLLDGGVDDQDHPYMAMEYVDGLPLLDYCRQHGLDLRARLTLFRSICDAAAYAHRRLVIHRDIKPANILVRADGTPKLLDFGIASLIDESGVKDGQLTQALYTPNYAAPEQLAGGQITTATDVHGLGAVLYALLSGDPPQQLEGLALPAAINRVLTATPPAPSTVTGSDNLLRGHAWAGDLDAICAMALRKEPDARYPSVLALCEDIDAMLALRPVRARRGAKRYIAGRFVRRNRIAVASSALVLALIIGALGMTTFYAHRAAVERDVALRDAARVASMRDAMARVLGAAGSENESGEPLTAVGLLDNALSRLDDELADDPASHAAGLRMIGSIFFAMDDYRRAEPILERIATTQHPDVPGDIRALAQFDLSQIRFEAGDTAGARKLFDQAYAYWQANESRHEVQLIHSASMLSRLYRVEGEPQQAVGVITDAVRRADRLWGRNHEETAIVLSNLVVAHFYNNDMESAQQVSAQTWAVWEALDKTDTVNALNTLANWGSIARKRGDLITAAERIQLSTELRESLYGPSAALARQMIKLSRLQADNGKLEAALATVDRALPMALEYGERGDKLTTALGCQRGYLLLLDGRHQEALKALETTLINMTPHTQNDIYGTDCRVLRGHALAVAGEFDRAEDALDSSIETLRQTGEPGKPHLSLALSYRARLALYRGDADAVERFQQALEIKQALHGEDHYQVQLLRCELGRALVAAGDVERGRQLMDTAAEALKNQFGMQHALYQRAQAIRTEAAAS
ncbi:MAG: serine/threonine-protein kinase [Abyssibacter sp.]|uniref:serine/threonine-protein kinase n=1 Tax=Abyssibacter sp. TaxID=2320200 RepID=UPI00321C2356